MSRILQRLIHEADSTKIDEALKLIDGGDQMDDDFNEIFHQILECGLGAYGAAKAVDSSGRSQRSMATLWHHARQIEANLLDFFGVSVESLLQELKTKYFVTVPDELIAPIRHALHDSGMVVEERVTLYWTNHPGAKV